MKISVIVLTHNSENTVSACLSSLKSQTYRNREIIVIDDNSSDKTLQMVKKFPVKLILTKKGTSVGESRNIGIERSKGDIVAFTDSDVRVPKDWLKQIVFTFKKNPTYGAVGGTLINKSNLRFAIADYLLFFSEYLPNRKEGFARWIPTVNVAYRRQKIKNLKFSDVDHCEDILFNYKFLKKKNLIFFSPDLFVYHYSQIDNFKKFVNKQKNFAESFVAVRKKTATLPGSLFIKYRLLNLFVPRLFTILKRVIFSGFFIEYLKCIDLIILAEIIRIYEIFKNRN